jgi:hypothetical protein
MQTTQGCAMRRGRLGKSYGIIRSSQYFTLTCNWEMSALTKSISVGGFKPPSPVHVHSCRFRNLDIFVRFWNAPMYVHPFRSCVRTVQVVRCQPKHSDCQGGSHMDCINDSIKYRHSGSSSLRAIFTAWHRLLTNHARSVEGHFFFFSNPFTCTLGFSTPHSTLVLKVEGHLFRGVLRTMLYPSERHILIESF